MYIFSDIPPDVRVSTPQFGSPTSISNAVRVFACCMIYDFCLEKYLWHSIFPAFVALSLRSKIRIPYPLSVSPSPNQKPTQWQTHCQKRSKLSTQIILIENYT